MQLQPFCACALSHPTWQWGPQVKLTQALLAPHRCRESQVATTAAAGGGGERRGPPFPLSPQTAPPPSTFSLYHGRCRRPVRPSRPSPPPLPPPLSLRRRRHPRAPPPRTDERPPTRASSRGAVRPLHKRCACEGIYSRGSTARRPAATHTPQARPRAHSAGRTSRRRIGPRRPCPQHHTGGNAPRRQCGTYAILCAIFKARSAARASGLGSPC